jgi:hypothetical protein
MNEIDGDNYFQSAMPTLQRVIRKINKIGAALPDPLPESILTDLQVIFESAVRLPDLLALPDGELAALAGELARLSPPEAVNKLTAELTLRE